MNSNILFFGMLFLVSSCGALKLNPTGCQNEGVWSEKTSSENPGAEMAISEEYYIWNNDYEVRLKELLKTKKIRCNEIKRMRVTMKSVFFVKRELTVYIQK